MIKRNLAQDPVAERQQLLYLALGLGTLAAGLWFFRDARVLAGVLAGIALVALAGLAAYRFIGRDIYLFFALISLAIGTVVSSVMLALMYLFGIAIFGSLLRLLGMDRLRKRFDRCREQTTMFAEAPSTDVESFRRQS